MQILLSFSRLEMLSRGFTRSTWLSPIPQKIYGLNERVDFSQKMHWTVPWNRTCQKQMIKKINCWYTINGNLIVGSYWQLLPFDGLVKAKDWTRQNSYLCYLLVSLVWFTSFQWYWEDSACLLPLDRPTHLPTPTHPKESSITIRFPV